MKVSVVTTLFNYRQYIGECIESFLAQDEPDSEMVIVDDCSTDNPIKVIQPYIGSRLRYIRLDKNGGYSHAKNVGVRAASADVLVMLDADDMLTKNGISVRYEKLKEGFDFVHGPVWNFKGGKMTSDMPRFQKWLSSKKDESCYKLIHAQSVMLRKSVHSVVGLYDETLRCKSDREMWARILARPQFKIGWTNEPVAIYRQHGDQMHKSKFKLKNNEKLEREVLRRISQRRTDLSGLEML